MITDLSPEEALGLLASHAYAHLGCSNDGKPYVVPTSYCLIENAICGYTYEGFKVDTLRKNPNICIQVEELEDASHWKSVIAYGTYKELEGDEQIETIKFLIRIFENRNEYIPFKEDGTSKQKRDEGNELVVWKMTPEEITGKKHEGGW
ncbi:MAG: pyridoxamine 5'-phosphate oxidase family protein [bacterium]|nr:pyridoxamine 5'-phosphate oxidase family protein [bacterium]